MWALVLPNHHSTLTSLLPIHCCGWDFLLETNHQGITPSGKDEAN
ncbi:hypothetical protein SynROS8604_00390 [Synechococcus sp. ROS8604]|nr:hypothetical protein SynROS8604_00390 [Synechococcus sp. ROS8604]